jgi:hypothetical protein
MVRDFLASQDSRLPDHHPKSTEEREATNSAMADYKTYLASNILTEDKVVCSLLDLMIQRF